MALPDLSVDAFRASITQSKSKPTGIKYAQAATRFLAFCSLNGLKLEDLPAGALNLFCEYLRAEGLAPASVATFSAGAKRYLEWLKDRGRLIPHIARADLPRKQHGEPNIIKGNAIIHYIHHASQAPEPARTAMLLLPYCGLRSEEMVTLKLSNVEKVKTPAFRDRPSRHVVMFTFTGKGQKRRSAPLLLDGIPLLLAYLKNWRAKRPGDWLFPMESGRHMSTRTLRKHIQAVRIRAQLGDKLTPHTLRRTYLTTLFREGLDPVTIAKIAGHESIQTTKDHYLAIESEDIAGATGDIRLVAKGALEAKVQEASLQVTSLLKSTSAGRVVELPDAPPIQTVPPEEEDDWDDDWDDDEDEDGED